MLPQELSHIPSLQVGAVGRSVGGSVGRQAGRSAGGQGRREGGKERWMEVFCEHYNIAIGCPCCVQPVL